MEAQKNDFYTRAFIGKREAIEAKKRRILSTREKKKDKKKKGEKRKISERK